MEDARHSYDVASTVEYQHSPRSGSPGPSQAGFTATGEDGSLPAGPVLGSRFGSAFSSFTSRVSSALPSALTSFELPSHGDTASYFEHAADRAQASQLQKVLGWKELLSLGIGCTIGAGIFVVTGVVAATKAGPALFLCYIVSAVACCFAGLCYAELAAMSPTAGSAYSYARASLGQTIGWTIGWDLCLEYAVSGASVAQGWSKYFNALLDLIGIRLPDVITQAPWAYDSVTGEFTSTGAVLDLPALLITVLITFLLVRGMKESARFATAMVVLKIAIVLFVIFLGMFYMKADNFTPFMPYGFFGLSFFGYTAFGQTGPDGSPVGVFAGASIVFFSYIGFDTVTCQAEETINPQRNLPIGIIGSLAISTVLYVAVSLVLVGMVPYTLIDLDAPLSDAFGRIGLGWAEGIIAVGAIVGITSVLLVTLMGQPRILLTMSRDGLLPESFFGAVHPEYGTPYKSTILTGGIVAVLASLIPLSVLVELVSIGTLLAFTIVCCSIIILRRSAPHVPRPFLCPWVPVVPGLGAFICVMLMLSLPSSNWVRLVVWLAIGLLIYIFYGHANSKRVMAERQQVRARSAMTRESSLELQPRHLPEDSSQIDFGAVDFDQSAMLGAVDEEANPFEQAHPAAAAVAVSLGEESESESRALHALPEQEQADPESANERSLLVATTQQASSES